MTNKHRDKSECILITHLKCNMGNPTKTQKITLQLLDKQHIFFFLSRLELEPKPTTSSANIPDKIVGRILRFKI